MWKPCACSWRRNETGNESRVKRSRSGPCECMTGHNRPPGTTTSCWNAKDLKLATVGGQFLTMAEEAVKQKHGHLSYLEALLGAEVEDRYQHGVARRITEAHFPKVKTLEDFAFSDAPHLPAAQIRNLAEGGYLSRSEPIIFLGE